MVKLQRAAMVVAAALPCPVTLLSLLSLLHGGWRHGHGGFTRSLVRTVRSMRWWGRTVGEVRGEVCACSGSVVARAASSDSGGRRGTAGAEETHTAGNELRASNIGLGVDSPRRAHPLLPSRSATR